MCNKPPPGPESSDPMHIAMKRHGRRLRGSPGAFPPPAPPAKRPPEKRDGRFIFAPLRRLAGGHA